MTQPQTFTSYDEVPYPSAPKSETHPTHLAVLATLFGVNPAPLDHCRVLELGCADGSNLIPMACRLPDSEFVGIDLSSRQIEAGQAVIEALGLKNITLQALDILDFGTDRGKFDYIIVYGIYSWVPPEVQNKIFQICRQNLAPQGVAYISYNVYPGWHMYKTIRDMMLFRTRDIADPKSRVEQARAILNFMVEAAAISSRSSEGGVYNAYSLILEGAQEVLSQRPDSYLLHDLLEEFNEPLYFYQFMERAAGFGLQYLAESEFSTMLASHFPAEVTEPLRRIVRSGLDVEQYMDFLRNRTFRQTLLCHEEIELKREVKPEILTRFYIASPVMPVSQTPAIDSTGVEKFKGKGTTILSTGLPLAKSALLYLAEIWPQAVSFEVLLAEARSRLDPAAGPVYSPADLAADTERLSAVLWKGYTVDLIELRAYPLDFTLEVSEYPTVDTLARWQVKEGRKVTNQRHEIIKLEDEVSYQLVFYLDGSHNHAALLDVLVDLVANGTLVVKPDGEPFENKEQTRSLLAEVLERCLQRLARSALLVA